MVFAWLLTLPGAALVGGLAALLADQGVMGASARYWCYWQGPAWRSTSSLGGTGSPTPMSPTATKSWCWLPLRPTAAAYSDDPRLEAPPKLTKKKKTKKAKQHQTEERRLMHVDWAALAIVAVVSIAASVIFTILLASGIRLVSAAKIKSNEGGSGTATVSLGYVLIGIAALVVLFGIYLIVPQFH